MCEQCHSRPEQVRLNLPEENKTIWAAKGENLLEVLRRNNVRVPAVCAGRGTCGKCRVRVDGQERLACAYTVEQSAEVCVPALDDGYDILTEYELEPLPDAPPQEGYAFAVDIGTTTVVLQLLDRQARRVVAQTSFVNAQRSFGADVISRIKAAGEGHLETLHARIACDLLQAFESVCAKAGVAPGQVCQLQIAGNTTMLYLLLGNTCASLGQYPFTPEHPWRERYTFEEVFQSTLLSCPVELVPWISAFVGGDITAGLLYCAGRGAERFLLVDIGTNGEMAVQTGEGILCTSTAAGPAFEGGNITCGMGGVRGAICAAQLRDGAIVCSTIGDAPALGICGSGVLDVGACLVEGGFMDENGLLEDAWFDDGVELAKDPAGNPIVFTQKDVRELQLAKAAIRAGIEILVEEAGGYAAIDRVYLSGGFGRHMRVASAVALGMLPRELAEKTVPCGNSALGGSALLCLDARRKQALPGLLAAAREINLSAHPRFNDLFMEHMLFT